MTQKSTAQPIFLGLFLVLCSFYSQAQLSFTNQTEMLTNSNIQSGAPVGVADMNGDFLDDIIRFDGTTNMTIDYQNADGTFTEYDYGNVTNDAWAIAAGDINNDGYAEIMAGGAYNSTVLLNANGKADYTYSILNGPTIFVQGSQFCDFNNDGFLDLFACHDDGPSSIWMNNGLGNLAYSGSTVIDLAIHSGEENNSGNYGVVWTDFDSDGDFDMYIAKCRQGANNVTDVRRINQLWVNDGNNNYTENAAAYGLDIGWQTWTAEFQDIDNDGDMDCFLTNHDYESQLLENIDNISFVDITASSGINITGLPIEATMKDFDNDGFVDLLVTGQMYINNGNKTFRLMPTNPLDNPSTFGVGDLNHDGFLDVYCGYGNGLNSPNGIDQLMINDGNSNNFFAVNLNGQQSNRNGVGARIELHGDWGIMIREVRAGESYGIFHSYTQHFGLGTNQSIDSLVVKWPSGTIDVFDDVNPNQFVTILEGNCISPEVSITLGGSAVLCEGEEVTLTAPSGFSYLWSTGETSQAITVDTEGNYSVIIDDGTGCLGQSSTINITNPVEEASISYRGENTFCQGDSVVLTVTTANSYLWSTGETTKSITVTETGDYSVEVEGLCSTLTSEVIPIVVFPAPPTPIVMDVTINEPGSAILSADGTNVRWFNDTGLLFGMGNTFVTPFLTETTTFYVEDTNIADGEQDANIGEANHTGSSEYSGDQYNGDIVFDAEAAFLLKTVKVHTDMPGERIIELHDAQGNVLQDILVDLMGGDTILTLNFDIPAANNLSLTTNELMNQMTLGTASPRMRRTSIGSGGNVDYPYVIDNVVSLKTSTIGDNWYYYFYNWTIELPSMVCASPRVPVTVTISNPTTAVFNINEIEDIKVYPNPTSDILTIDIKAGNAFDIQLTDITGKLLMTDKIIALGSDKRQQIHLNKWAKGMYWLQFTDTKNTYTTKVILQ